MTTPAAVTIDTANPEQAAAWNGHEGEHWAAHADRFERIGSTIWQRLLDRDLIGHDDRVLDVGCGTGGVDPRSRTHRRRRVCARR